MDVEAHALRARVARVRLADVEGVHDRAQVDRLKRKGDDVKSREEIILRRLLDVVIASPVVDVEIAKVLDDAFGKGWAKEFAAARGEDERHAVLQRRLAFAFASGASS